MSHPSAPPAPGHTLVVISHTHWDREWYLPFHEYRLRLTEMMKNLLHLLETDSTYRCFHLDGHSAVVEDYLEMHPEDAGRVQALATAGRLLFGPWYILPDEFLVGGESLVRNLLVGRAVARRYGEPMPVGYLPDQFGHVGQIPQILRGFGLESAVIWRGVAEPADRTEFWWESPDGSRVLTAYLRFSYSLAENLPEEPHALAYRLRELQRQLEPLSATPFVYIPNGNDHAFPQHGLGKALVSAARLLGPDVDVVHGSLPDLIAGLRAYVERERVQLRTLYGEFRSGMRTPLLPGVLSARLWIKQRNAAAEFLLEKWAEPFGAFEVMTRSREALGDAHAEDAALRHRDWTAGALKHAWKCLLQNQPHDSICGCSIDPVHDEMRARFSWVEQTGGRVRDRALHDIAARIDVRGFLNAGREQVMYMAVFNPSSHARTDATTVTLRVPRGEAFAVVDNSGRPLPAQVIARHDLEVFSTEVRRAELERVIRGLPQAPRVAGEEFASWVLRRAHATDGRLGITHIRLAQGPRPESLRLDLTAEAGCQHDHGSVAELVGQLRAVVSSGHKELLHLRVYRPDMEDVDLAFVARDVPSHGYTTVAVVEHATADDARTVDPTLHERHSAPQPTHIENEHFVVAVDPRDGTLTVTDKSDGRQYARLHRFESRGDAGDEYNFSPPAFDRTVCGFVVPPDIRLEECGPVRWTLAVTGMLRLPVSLAADRQSRSEATVDCPVVVAVSLTAGVRRVDIRTEIDNRAQDHRLRVLFPTGIGASASHAEGHFGVVERPVAIPQGGHDWTEDPTGTYPQKTFVDITDGTRGLAVANRGLPEFEVLSGDDSATVALTLLRCVGWLSRDDLATRRGYAGPALPTPGAQMLGTHVFEYAIIPHAGTWRNSIAPAHDLNLPLRAVMLDGKGSSLPPEHSFLHVTPTDVQVSAVKLPESGDGMVVRLYNPTGTGIEARLQTAWPLICAAVTDLEETPQGDLLLRDDGKSVVVEVGPSKIVTVRAWPADGKS